MYKGRTIAQGTPIRIREMIEDQPHSIQITVKDSKKLSTLLINNANEDVVSQIQFQKDIRSNENQLVVLTNKPREFYSLVTDLVCDHEIPIIEIKATNEGLQNLYKLIKMFSHNSYKFLHLFNHFILNWIPFVFVIYIRSLIDILFSFFNYILILTLRKSSMMIIQFKILLIFYGKN